MVCNISKTYSQFVFLRKPGVIFINKTKAEEGIQKKANVLLLLNQTPSFEYIRGS
jgi:hypothetical protein